MNKFADKVDKLVERLVEDIAAVAKDGDEFSDGLIQAATSLLDDGAAEFDENDDFDPFDDEDDLIWPDEWDDELEDEDDDIFGHQVANQAGAT